MVSVESSLEHLCYIWLSLTLNHKLFDKLVSNNKCFMVLFLIRIQRRAKAKIRDVLKINNNNMYRKVLNEIFF